MGKCVYCLSGQTYDYELHKCESDYSFVYWIIAIVAVIIIGIIIIGVCKIYRRSQALKEQVAVSNNPLTNSELNMNSNVYIQTQTYSPPNYNPVAPTNPTIPSNNYNNNYSNQTPYYSNQNYSLNLIEPISL